MTDSNTEETVRDYGLSRNFSSDNFNTEASDAHRQMIGVRLPRRQQRPGRSSSSRRHREQNGYPKNSDTSNSTSMSPSEHIQQLIGENEESHFVFCQMDTLYTALNEYQWRETARWVKYEEDVEDGGERWSKPHVASLSLHSLFELRSSLLMGAVMLDMDAFHITQVADLIIDQLINAKLLESNLRDNVRAAIIANHAHQHQKRRRSMMPTEHESMADFRKRSMKRNFSSQMSFRSRDSAAKLNRNPTSVPENIGEMLNESASSAKLNQQFMKKIPDGAEAANILVGELDCLKYQITAFVRLTEARSIGDMTEVPLPTRFIFLLLGPPGSQNKNVEMGRSMSTLMVDEVFREVAFRAKNRQDILSGIDEFLDQVTVLPPGEWDPKIRIEPPDKVPSQDPRKQNARVPEGPKVAAEQVEEEECHADPTLQRTGRLFGGLIEDVKRKIPWYASDFKDCLHIQCVASTLYLYLATLTPNVTFGGLLGLATNQYMGTMECILTAAIVGILFALFAGQPLNILGSTGPMLVLEMIVYSFCMDQGWDYMPVRAWTGIWTTVIIMLVVAFDLSALVRYITRFTEESFACLIAIIFIYEAIKKVIGITKLYPVNLSPEDEFHFNCSCILTPPDNATYFNTTDLALGAGPAYAVQEATTMSFMNSTSMDYASLSEEMCKLYNGTMVGPDCASHPYVADVFFLSIILFFGTYFLATSLKEFKTSGYFPTFVRQIVSDFAVLIAIIVMVGLDIAIGIGTPKLEVPEKFSPTKPGRSWFINPISDKNPWWVILVAIVPAFLSTILIFLDQQITAVIVNRKENKLKKGNGYHLDMFVVGVCVLICSLFGLPWYVAATVSALAHIMSLKKESESTAPGEKPVFLGCREQRVTALVVGILSGLSVFMTKILKVIPMPVLYGVFMYMGVAALKGMQFVDRIALIAMPKKYQPDHMYLRHVPIKRVHLFTLFQIVSLAVLWVVKMIKSISILFPVMVLGTCIVRKLFEYIFSQRELKWLDDLMPEDKKMAKEDQEKAEEDEKENLLEDNKKFNYGDRVNISEEVNKTGMWLQVRRSSTKGDDSIYHIKNDRNRKNMKNEENVEKKGQKAAFYFGENA
ncbi:sodium bicarbonate cotransporter 3-like isoform X2 [Ostrea edulis]|uniref:sodium bicarbonate cotransporter 3-like isoform X2 n=1 Tax=Ostrea edulis TaxID=37623 RepID=UPI0024AFE614|nr:sodium bicarbonate cotransporter 3-like isoform X2 [Ostrea edulis]XP_056012280.1 sodium bicarbonate cotransporter 3-like isoform X2 [Ostrea edulis]